MLILRIGCWVDYQDRKNSKNGKYRKGKKRMIDMSYDLIGFIPVNVLTKAEHS